MEVQVEDVATVLSAANTKARNVDNVDADDRSFHVSQTSDHPELCIYNAQLLLHAASVLMNPRLVHGSLPLSRREGYLLRDLDEETRRRVSRPVTTLKPEEGKKSRRSFPKDPSLKTDDSKSPGLSLADLSSHLVFDKTALERDVERCSAISVVKPTKMMQRLSKLTRRPAFKNWLSETSQSSAILIHGNLQTRIHVTPLSHLCAKISKEYTGKPGFIIMSYFCGLHANVGTEGADAKAMLMCLIAQLLSHPDMARNYDPGSFNRHIIKGLKRKDINMLGKLLRVLINQLRSTSMVVFCLIDSISYYEDSSRSKDTQEVLSLLHGIVTSQRGRRRQSDDKFVFKLMVTAGAKSVNAYRYFKREDILEMNESVDGNSRLKLI